MRTLCRQLILWSAACTVSLGAGPANAAPPPNAVVITSAASVRANELAGFVVLPGGTVFMSELADLLAPHAVRDDVLLVWDVASSRVIDATREPLPVPFGSAALYRSRDQSLDLALVGAAGSGPVADVPLLIPVDGSDTLGDWLGGPGRVAFFNPTLPVPEPGARIALPFAIAALVSLRRLRLLG